MKRWIAAFLLAVLLITSVSCAEEKTTESASGTQETKTAETQTNGAQTEEAPAFAELATPVLFPEVQISEESKNYTQLKQVLTWESVTALPQKRSNMTVEEMRSLCVEFFRFAKTAVWIADDDLYFRKNKAVDTPEVIQAGTAYGGLPYVSTGSGNIYRLFDYMDPATGMVDLSAAVDIPSIQADTSVVSKSMMLFGNQCSIGAYWAWARVINSANYDWTNNMVQARGFVRVGPYTYKPYSELISSFTSTNTTQKVTSANGSQVMFESYALLQPADGLVQYLSSGGHTLMCSGTPYVVRNDDGTIDGNKSYITIIDQTSAGTWYRITNAAGDTYYRKNSVDARKSFTSLYNGGYLPFTFKEFLGQDPVEPTECTFNHTGESITPSQLSLGKVQTNYSISDIYAILKDTEGKVLHVDVVRSTKANVKGASFASAVTKDEWKEFAGKGYTVEVVAQLGTGERPLLYRGTLIAEN